LFVRSVLVISGLCALLGSSQVLSVAFKVLCEWDQGRILLSRRRSWSRIYLSLLPIGALVDFDFRDLWRIFVAV